MEKITIPKVQGNSKYCLIKILWEYRALVRTTDQRIMYPVQIQVNARPICLCRLHDYWDKKHIL